MDRSELVKLVKKLSYQEGDFTLASGQKSSFYVDLKNTTLDPEGADLIGKAVLAALPKDAHPIEGVGGLTLGADPIATAVSLAAYAQGHHWPAFIVRKEPKGHGTSQYVEGTSNLQPGARLLVVEDVATTGGSSLKAVTRLRDVGYNPVGVISIVDRESGARAAFEAAGLQFWALMTLEEVKTC